VSYVRNIIALSLVLTPYLPKDKVRKVKNLLKDRDETPDEEVGTEVFYRRHFTEISCSQMLSYRTGTKYVVRKCPSAC
jgi:hypothetical protein